MELKTRVCPICGNNNYLVLFTDKNRRGDCKVESSYVNCATCSHVYLNPIPDLFELFSAYNEMPVVANENLIERLLNKIEYRLSWFTDKSKFYHSMPHEKVNQKKLLDIGCNDGKKLVHFNANGWEIYGVDVSKPAIESARKRIPDGNFYLGTVDSINFTTDYFDCVRIDNVLEHIEEPIITLTEIYRILKPGGKLYIYVPNGNSFTFKHLKQYSINSWIPFHLNLFTKSSITYALFKAGFSKNSIEVKFCTPLPWLFLSLKQLVRGKSGLKMNFTEKCLSTILIPIAVYLNTTEMAEEIVIKAVK